MNAIHYSEMRTIKRVLCFITFLSISLNTLAQVTVQGLMTEASVTPLGIDEKKPAFTWQMKATGRGYQQTAYQILVTDGSGAVAWDSKKINSSSSLNIPYAGSPLRPTTRYTLEGYSLGSIRCICIGVIVV